jgi:capsular exopolysaccharide synthesis family protein
MIMKKNGLDIPGSVAASIDKETNISVREILSKLFYRFRIFLACAILVPVVSLFVTYMVPPVYKASAKVLIKNEKFSSSFFGDIAAERQLISGQSNAEIMRSIPVNRRVVESLKLQDADITKPSYIVFIYELARPFYWLFPGLRKSPDKPFSEQEIIQLAGALKESIETKIVQKERGNLLYSDELIEVVVKSPNPEKVALIANQLCRSFIDEYYLISEADAMTAYEYLVKAEAQLTSSKQMVDSVAESENRNVRTNPMVDSAARQVTDLEREVARLRQIYKENVPEVIKAKQELATARARLGSHESTESAKSLLSLYKDKKRQAFMSVQLYKNRLVPISIVEEAIPPHKSSLNTAIRYLLVGLIGLLIGVVLGFALTMFLSTIDSRLYTPWDLERIQGINVIGSIAAIEDPRLNLNELEALPLRQSAPALIQALGKLDLIGKDKCRYILVTSTSNSEGKTFTSLQMACALARDKRTKVLLIDGDFEKREISKILNHLDGEGLIEILGAGKNATDVILQTNIANLHFIPAGLIKDRMSLGFYKKSLRQAFDDVSSRYDTIIIDSAGILISNDATIFASEVDGVIIVVKSGVIRREPYLSALTALNQVGANILGTILNFRRFPIPRYFA